MLLMLLKRRLILLITVLCTLYLKYSNAQNVPHQAVQSHSYWNKALHMSISSKKNRTGHMVALFSLDSAAAQLPSQWNADFNLNTSQTRGIQRVHAIGAYVETPHSDDFNKRPVPARYVFYPGVGYYKFYNSTLLNFHEAVYNCSVDGGHLSIINSAEEANLFRQLQQKSSTGGNYVYSGFNDLQKEGEFRTVFGQLLNETGYSAWAPNEPTKKKQCGFFDSSSLLHVMDCTSKRPFICEFHNSEAT